MIPRCILLLLLTAVYYSIENCFVTSFQFHSVTNKIRSSSTIPYLTPRSGNTIAVSVTDKIFHNNNHHHQHYRSKITTALSQTRLLSKRLPNKLDSNTKLNGIDYDAIQDDEECDFFSSSNTDNMELITKSITSSATAAATTTTTTTTFQTIQNCIELPQPNPDFTAEDVVNTCMKYLSTNDEPKQNCGLEVCFNFSSDRCRAAQGGTLESFLQFAANPTFQSLVNASNWKTVSVGPEIPGTNTRGAMKTVLISVVPSTLNAQVIEERQFLWTLQKERRPPRQGCWLVHECIFVDNFYTYDGLI